MTKFLVSVWIEDGGKKITAIKEIRSAFGIGLAEAKNFVESNQCSTPEVILNSEQVARLLELTYGACSGAVDQPYFIIRKIRTLTQSGIDFSNETPR